MTQPATKAKTIIGWREWCAMDSLGLPAIAAKIDTGATTSSLHAFRLRYFEQHGEQWVRFFAHPLQRHKHPEIECCAKVFAMRDVVSSNGIAEQRPVIQASVRLGTTEIITELTLSNRDEMGYRMLVGRKTLAGRFVVDPALSWTLGDIDAGSLY